MIPFTPTQEELPRLLDGSQTLVVRAVEAPEANAAALGRDYTYPDVIKWADQIAVGVCYPRKGHWCGLVDMIDRGDRGRGRAWTYDIECPLGAPGDSLWCKEEIRNSPENGNFYYTIDSRGVGDRVYQLLLEEYGGYGRNHAARHMPQEAARLYLRIKSVDCRRVQTVTPGEAIMAGFGPTGHGDLYWDAVTGTSVVDLFAEQWDKDNPTRPWSANHWAWFVRVERCERP